MKPIFLLAALTVALSSQAQQKTYPEISIPYTKYVLDNGLTLIVHEDHKVPIVSMNTYYHVGSKNEKPGKTGFAHLFEHIMFTSTEHWDNFDVIMQSVGGSNNNATTYYDRTNFFETFGSNGLDRVLWLESDRMGFLASGLDSVKVNVQRGVVQNEKRQGDNRPYHIASELTAKAMYPPEHPYSWTVIGSMEDLNAASIDDVKNWFRDYYGPNNAVICISGDVEASAVFDKVKLYFGDIPAGPPIVRQDTWIPNMTGVHTQQAEDVVPQARLQKTWHVPEWGTKDVTYLDLLTRILSNGKSSRLYKRLVYDEALASDVYSYVDDREISGEFYIYADAQPGISLDTLNEVANEILQSIIKEGVTNEELERAKTDYFVSFVNSVESLSGISDLLAACETYGQTPDYYKKVQQWIREATPEDLRKAAETWLSTGEYTLNITPYKDYTTSPSSLDRSKMPPVGKAPATSFPAVETFTLSNGLTVYLAELHNIPMITVYTSVNAGYAADKPGKQGLASLTGDMMTEGTKHYTSTELSDQLTDLGTQLSVSTGLDNTYVRLRTLTSSIDASLDLYTEVLLFPVFPQADFEREQKNTLLSIEQEKADPRQLGYRLLPGLLFGKGHPYSNPLTGSGTEASVEQLTRQDLVDFHRDWFKPNNAFMVVVGDISKKDLKSKLEERLGQWKKGTAPQKSLSVVQPIDKPAVYIINKPDAVQSALFFASLAPLGNDKKMEAIELMNTILGGSFVSRLNANLREDKHWTYGIYSSIKQNQGQSIFMASTSVQTDKTKESMEEILKELTQVNQSNPITPKEFDEEQTNTVLSIPGDWESYSGIASSLIKAVEFNKGLDYLNNYSSLLQHLTLQNIQEAAGRVVNPRQLTWVIIGDRSKIESEIRDLNLGTVTIIDDEGNPVK